MQCFISERACVSGFLSSSILIVMTICFLNKYILSYSLVIKSGDYTAISTKTSEIRRLFVSFEIHISSVSLRNW